MTPTEKPAGIPALLADSIRSHLQHRGVFSSLALVDLVIEGSRPSHTTLTDRARAPRDTPGEEIPELLGQL